MKRSFLSLLMTLTIVPMVFSAANSGNCGPLVNDAYSGSCTWKLDTVMHYLYGRCPRLTISGSGSTADFNLLNPQPWWENTKNIKIVVIEPGVTRLGNIIFYEMQNLREVSLGTVEELGIGAFYGCSALTTLTLPATLQRIGDRVFDECNALTAINPYNSTHFYSDNGVLYTYDKSELICFPPAADITDYSILPEATVLRQYAFVNATKLKVLRLHKDIKEYQKESLGGVGMSSLTDLYAPFRPVPSMPENAFNTSAQKSTVTLHVPGNLRDSYSNEPVWKDFTIENDLPFYYTDCIFINHKLCTPDTEGKVFSPKITAGTVSYGNKMLILDSAVVEGPIEADVLMIGIKGECVISGQDNNALHLHTETRVKNVAFFGMSEEAHLTIYANPTIGAPKPAAIYTESSNLQFFSSLSTTNNFNLGITIETTRKGIDAASACEIQLGRDLRFLRIRPTVTPAFRACCYTDKISFSLIGSEPSDGTTLSDEIDDENGYCLWEQGVMAGIEELPTNKVQNTKILRDGGLIIRVGDKEYNAQGLWVK